MTRLQRILIGAYRDLEQWRSTPRQKPPGDRRRIAQHNRRCDLAERGAVLCDVPRWLGEPQTNGNRVSNCRIYKELACKNLAHPIAEGKRRQRTIALALTEDGEALAKRLIDQSPVPTSATPLAPTSTTKEIELSRQANYERRQATAEAESPWTNYPVAPVTNPDDVITQLVNREPDEPPYTVAVGDEWPVCRQTIDELAAAGLLTIHEGDGTLRVALTNDGTLRAMQLHRDAAGVAKSTTATAGTSPTSHNTGGEENQCPKLPN